MNSAVEWYLESGGVGHGIGADAPQAVPASPPGGCWLLNSAEGRRYGLVVAVEQQLGSRATQARTGDAWNHALLLHSCLPAAA